MTIVYTYSTFGDSCLSYVNGLASSTIGRCEYSYPNIGILAVLMAVILLDAFTLAVLDYVWGLAVFTGYYSSFAFAFGMG